jgi:hypothetical protein
MVQNGTKWYKNDKMVEKWYKMVKNGTKWQKNGQNGREMVKIVTK